MQTPPQRGSRALELAASYRRHLASPDSTDAPALELFERLDDDARAWLVSLAEPGAATAAAPAESDAPAAARESIVRGFTDLTSSSIQERWERTQ